MMPPDHDDLLGDEIEDASPPTPEELADGIVPESERLKRHVQQNVDFVGEHCRSKRITMSDGGIINVSEPGQAPAPILKDGPAPDTTLRYRGESFAVPLIPWRLLHFMWERDHVSVDEVEESVWPDGARPSALKSAMHKLNEVLCKACYPKTLGQKQGVVLWN